MNTAPRFTYFGDLRKVEIYDGSALVCTHTHAEANEFYAFIEESGVDTADAEALSALIQQWLIGWGIVDA
jgi:hypothetical protein